MPIALSLGLTSALEREHAQPFDLRLRLHHHSAARPLGLLLLSAAAGPSRSPSLSASSYASQPARTVLDLSPPTPAGPGAARCPWAVAPWPTASRPSRRGAQPYRPSTAGSHWTSPLFCRYLPPCDHQVRCDGRRGCPPSRSRADRVRGAARATTRYPRVGRRSRVEPELCGPYLADDARSHPKAGAGAGGANLCDAKSAKSVVLGQAATLITLVKTTPQGRPLRSLALLSITRSLRSASLHFSVTRMRPRLVPFRCSS